MPEPASQAPAAEPDPGVTPQTESPAESPAAEPPAPGEAQAGPQSGPQSAEAEEVLPPVGAEPNRRYRPVNGAPRRFFMGLGGEFASLTQNSDFNAALDSINSGYGPTYPGFNLGHVNSVLGMNAFVGYRVTDQLGLALSLDWNTASSSATGSTPANTPINAAGTFNESITLQRFGLGVKGFYELAHTSDLMFYAAPSVGVNFFTSSVQLNQVTSAAVNTSSGVLTTTNLGASLGFGVNYYLSSRFGIYAEAGYQLASASTMAVSTALGTATFQQSFPVNMSGFYFTIGVSGILGGWAHNIEAPMSTMAY